MNNQEKKVKDVINERFIFLINHIISEQMDSNKSNIAQKLGLKANTFSEILNNRMNVGTDIISTLCEVYNASPDWILTGRGDMFRNDQKIGNIDSSNVVGANVNGTGINIHGASSELIDVIKQQQEQIGKLIDVINKLNDK